MILHIHNFKVNENDMLKVIRIEHTHTHTHTHTYTQRDRARERERHQKQNRTHAMHNNYIYFQ